MLADEPDGPGRGATGSGVVAAGFFEEVEHCAHRGQVAQRVDEGPPVRQREAQALEAAVWMLRWCESAESASEPVEHVADGGRSGGDTLLDHPGIGEKGDQHQA